MVKVEIDNDTVEIIERFRAMYPREEAIQRMFTVKNIVNIAVQSWLNEILEGAEGKR